MTEEEEAKALNDALARAMHAANKELEAQGWVLGVMYATRPEGVGLAVTFNDVFSKNQVCAMASGGGVMILQNLSGARFAASVAGAQSGSVLADIMAAPRRGLKKGVVN